LLAELLRKLDRKAVRRDEGERVFGADRLLSRKLVEDLHPPRERFGELRLLTADNALEVGRVLAEERIRVAHLLDDNRRQPMDAFEPDALRLIDRAAQQSTADVAAALVRRLDSFGDQEAHGPREIGRASCRERV